MTTPLTSLTGMPTGKKTRRGPKKRSAPGSPGKHWANAMAAHKAGDHASARKHAFSFIRSLPEQEPDPTDPVEAQEEEMPSVSQAQNAAMHAAASGHSTVGIPKKVGQEFVAADAGTKVGALPEHIRKQRLMGALKGFQKK